MELKDASGAWDFNFGVGGEFRLDRADSSDYLRVLAVRSRR